MPSLEEVLSLASGRLRLNIELKTVGNMYPGIEQKVTDLISSKGMRDDVILTSFDTDVLKKSRK